MLMSITDVVKNASPYDLLLGPHYDCCHGQKNPLCSLLSDIQKAQIKDSG